MYKRSFVLFLSYFNRNHDYFECHEVLEEHWKEVAPKERHHELVGFIQLATAMYHWRRGNTKGATRMFEKAYSHLTMHPTSPYYEGIAMPQLFDQISKWTELSRAERPFVHQHIPITDEVLLRHVQDVPLPDLNIDYIMHKHRLRDRTEVLELRDAAIRARHDKKTR